MKVTAVMLGSQVKRFFNGSRLLYKLRDCCRRVANEADKQLLFHSTHQILQLLFLSHIGVHVSEESLHFFNKYRYGFVVVLLPGLKQGLSSLFSQHARKS